MISGWGPDDLTGLTAREGGVTAAAGFRAAGVVAGVKASGRPDLAVVAADAVVPFAAKTTTNQVKASSCRWTDAVAASGAARGVVINAGNANVCTPDGAEHTQRMATATAHLLGCAADQVAVMSTGVIGVALPIERIEQALPHVVGELSETGGPVAAQAIMTTDTRTKQAAFEVVDEHGRTAVVAGMAKGVGMIEPTMATLLVVLTTDAEVAPHDLDGILTRVVSQTFNRISVDGDRSTSDTAVVMASGQRGQVDLDAIERGLYAVCADLAHQVIADGEGATRVAGVRVTSAACDSDAERVARAVATSLLVRAALHGADPNWGRVLMAIGNAGVELDLGRVEVAWGSIPVCRGGVAVDFDAAAVTAVMSRPEVELTIDLGAGHGEAMMLTCDLTPEYVSFNADYTT